MGLDVDTLFFPASAQLQSPARSRSNSSNSAAFRVEGQAWRWEQPRAPKTAADTSNMPSLKTTAIKHKLRRPLRKSCSGNVPSSSSSSHSTNLTASSSEHTNNSVSFQSVDQLTEGHKAAQNEEPHVTSQRQLILKQAEAILRSKRHVGVQVGATCPVCLTDDVDTQLSACGHLVHAKCITRWIQSGTRCPVCREPVVGVESAFSSPVGVLSKDHQFPEQRVSSPLFLQEEGGSATTSADEGQTPFEWGWFEDFEDFDEGNDDLHRMAGGFHYSQRRSLPNFPTSSSHNSIASLSNHHAPLLNRDISMNFEMCRTFPPIRAHYETPYAQSPYSWLRKLPSHRHIAAKIQIRSFRIVEVKGSGAQHAEYLMELELDGRYVSRWRRFSAISRFMNKLSTCEYLNTHSAWARVAGPSRWFNRLELSYLHQRCKLLEDFAQALLVECTTAHPLADLVECC